MKKRIYGLLIIAITLIIGAITNVAITHATSKNGSFNGLTIDVARHYYQVKTLKSFIHQVHIDDGQFVQLHLSDMQSFAIENNAVGQTLANATETNGVWQNNTTHQEFYSKAQIADLVSYAKQQHVTLIPEIDTPAHIDGLVATMKAAGKQNTVKKLICRSSYYGDEFRLSSDSIKFVSSIDTEVAQSFSGQKNARFHLGGDEFTNSTKKNPAYVKYLNALAAHVKGLGFIPEAWNDGFLKSNLKGINHDIQVTYWNWTADETGSAGAKRRKTWASMPRLIHDGFKVLNYNDYYLYFNVSPQNITTKNVKYMNSDMKQNWDPTIWDNDNDSSLNSLHNIVGSSVSIWSDQDKKITDQEIYNSSKTFIKSFLKLAKQPIN